MSIAEGHSAKSSYTESQTDYFAPRELPYLFEKEIIERQNRRAYLLDRYVPNVLTVIPMTLKFYSKYDSVHSPFLKYFKIVDRSLSVPSERYKQPMLESHNYGWIRNDKSTRPVFKLNSRIHVKMRTDITKFGEEMEGNRVTERPKFNGLPFYLR